MDTSQIDHGSIQVTAAQIAMVKSVWVARCKPRSVVALRFQMDMMHRLGLDKQDFLAIFTDKPKNWIVVDEEMLKRWAAWADSHKSNPTKYQWAKQLEGTLRAELDTLNQKLLTSIST